MSDLSWWWIACGDNRIIRNETEFKFMNDSPCDGKPRRQKGSETSCHSRLADRMELIEWQERDQLQGERERPLRAKELYWPSAELTSGRIIVDRCLSTPTRTGLNGTSSLPSVITRTYYALSLALYTFQLSFHNYR